MISYFRIYFSISFLPDSVDATGVWRALTQFLTSQIALPTKFSLSQIAGHPEHLKSEFDLSLSPKEIEEVITERGLTGFHVNTGHSESSVAYMLGETTLVCRIENLARAPSDWTNLIETCLMQGVGIGGWQIFWPYWIWQHLNRTTDFGSTWGQLPPGYRTWHMPDPLGLRPGWTMLDISTNPGRTKDITSGVKFYPTAEMWLGPHFWQYAKCTKEEALAADFWLETRDTPNYTYFKCWPTPFTRPDGEQGRMQQRLWKLFFQEDCEWPPGSGTICDEPMYGPPELMPGFPGNVLE